MMQYEYGTSLDQVYPAPMSSKMTKSTFPENKSRHFDHRATKLHNILGLSEADLKDARNQSLSPEVATKIQSNSLSDATTAVEGSPSGQHKINIESRNGYSVPPKPISEHSSLTETTAPSTHKTYDSSSTFHSYYEIHNSSVAPSRQHSKYPNHLPLRETQSTTASPRTAGADSFWGFKLFKSTTSLSSRDSKKLARARAPASRTIPSESTTPTEWRSMVDSLTPKRPRSTKSAGNPAKSKEGGRPVPVPTHTAAPRTAKHNATFPLDPTCVKVNIRKPKAGAKHWFDGLEGDSSEDDDFDEPELQQNFVLGIENAFQNDRIKARSSSKQSYIPTNTSCDSHSLDDSHSTPHKSFTRVAVLNAKASQSNLSTTQSHKSQSKPLQQVDLTEQSVLDLSSDEENETLPTTKFEPAWSGLQLRDSVAMDSTIDAGEELSTAKTINVKSMMKPIEVVRIRRPSPDLLTVRDQSRMVIPKRGSSLAPAPRHHFHENRDDSDLLAAFPAPATPVESVAPSLNFSVRSSSLYPATPVESLAPSLAPSFNTSIRSSMALSSAGSMESRRLMTVTRQEESLLAAMRLKKAAMKYNNSRTQRPETINSIESRQSPTPGSTPTHSSSVSQRFDRAQQNLRPNLASRRHRAPLQIGDDISSSLTSGTNFEIVTPLNAAHPSRRSLGIEKTDRKASRLSLSPSIQSDHHSLTPSLYSSAATGEQQRRDTDVSASTAGNERPLVNGHHRTLTINSHVVALDDLDLPQRRDPIPSQEFIDWPYKGWETRLELGFAQ